MSEIPLGKKSEYPEKRDPSVLFPVQRGERSFEMYGFDLWRAFELSWLNSSGKPHAAILKIAYPLQSKCIVESKSLKLYLGGLAYEKFASEQELLDTIKQDLQPALGTPQLELQLTDSLPIQKLDAICIDGLEIETGTYLRDPQLLKAGQQVITEKLCSHLLRSFCPITRQPDWGSVIIEYRGSEIEHAGLLKYIISLRNHEGFHESCCEEIFSDISEKCAPDYLKVSCLYTRRGGIDINPVRSSEPLDIDMNLPRLSRQ